MQYTSLQQHFKHSIVLFLFFAVGATAVSTAQAQSTANYSFATGTNGSLAADLNSNVIDLTSGATTLLGSGLDDTQSPLTNLNLGTGSTFEFYFMGNRYTQFGITENGVATLGVVPAASQYTLPNATTPTLAPFANDLRVGTDGSVVAKVVGTAPNRTLVVQWTNVMIRYLATAAAGTGTFQMRLYETTGVIEYVYGTMTTNSASPTSYYVGFSVNTTLNNVVTVNTSTQTATTSATVTANTYTASSTITALNSATNGSRRFYRFSPPGSPTHATVMSLAPPTGLNFTAVGLSAMTLNWTAASPLTNILKYDIYRSTDNITFTFVASVPVGTNTYTATGLNGNTTYYWRVHSQSEGALSSPATGTQATNACSFAAGTYTVGPTGAYATITAALTDIQSLGLAGNVILELQPGYTSGGETFPLTIGALGCANSLTIRPQAGATGLSITSASATATIDLNGAQLVTIDGRPGGVGTTSQLTIANTNTAALAAVRFINGAQNNTITYSTVQGVATSTSGGLILFSTSAGSVGNSNNTISNNNIRDGATTPTNGIFSAGSSAALPNNGNSITNNNIFNFFNSNNTSAGIWLNANSASWTITGNSLYQTATRTFTAGNTTYGIYSPLANTQGGFTISNNFIGGGAPGAGGSAWNVGGAFAGRFVGIFLYGNATASTIQTNTIANFVWSSTSGVTTNPGVWGGIHLANGDATITGNTIGAATGTGSVTVTTSTTGALSIGIGAASSGTVTISNNTIGSITVVGTASVSHSFFGINNTAGTSVTISGNTLGSLTTPNSINFSSPSTNATVANMTGIVNSGGTTVSITNNTVSNWNNAYVGTSSGRSMSGIVASIGSVTVSGNVIRNLTTASGGAGTTTSAALIGISYTATSNPATITNNQVYALTASNTGANAVVATGIFYSGTTTITALNTISRNLIYNIGNASTSASAIVQGINIGGGISEYFNNMIRLGYDATGTAIANGIQFVGVDKTTASRNSVFFNSVFIGGTATSLAGNTFAFRRTLSGTQDSIINNIFVNERNNSGSTGKHYAIGLSAYTAATTAISNNVYYGTGSGFVFGYVGATDYTTQTAWTAVVTDPGSVFGNPQFIAPTAATPDLHLSAGVPTPAEGAGIAIAFITQDYDGQSRASFTATDIGADAGNFTPGDLAAPTITFTNIVGSCSTADQTLTATITDGAGVPTTGSLVPRIFFRKNGGSYSSAAGTLASGSGTNGTWTFVISSATLGGVASGDVISYFVIAQDVVGNVGSNPGGVVATDVNTVTTPPATPASYSINYTLNGAYNVGAGQTFTSLTQAVNAYNTACVTGPVVFNLTDATYSTGETFPITVLANAQASSTNTLTIKPAAGNTAIVTGSSATAIIKLHGADYVTIDGSNSGGTTQNLTVANTGAAASAVIWVASMGGAGNGAINNTIKNTIVTGGSGTTSGIYGIVSSATTSLTTAAADNDNLTVQNNAVSKVYIGISALTSSTAGLDAGGLVIASNSIGSNTATDYVTFRGIEVSYATAPSIQYNTVFNMITTASINNAAIDLGAGVINGQVSNNVIRSVHSMSTSGYGAYGINFSSTTATSGVTVANNSISDLKTSNYSTTSTSFNAFGIRITGGTNLKIYYNSINMFGAVTGGTSAGMSANLTVTSSSVTGLDIRNNIFVNTQTFGVAGSFAYNVFLGTTGIAFGTINYNDYYGTSGTNTTYRVGYTGSAAAAALSNWQTFTTQDANSVAIQPVFVSTTDLHLVPGSNVTLDNLGTPISGITTDYDGATRSATAPDMGFDEFTAPACVTAVGGTASTTATSFCGSGSATIANAGYSTGSGSTYQWESSTDNVTFGNVTGQTNPATIATGTLTSTTYYRLKVTCATNTSTDYSNTVTITVNPAQVASITPATAAVCAGSSASLTENGGTATGWTWSNAATTQAITVTPATATVYSVTVTGPGGCSATAQRTVSVNPIPTGVAASASSAAVCNGTPVNLSSTVNALPANILSENFNTGATGWTVTNAPTSPAVSNWHFQSGPYNDAVGGTTFANFNTVEGGSFAFANADTGGSGTTTSTILTSPAFSTVGYTTATLSFEHAYKSWSSDQTVKVELSTDGGATWNTTPLLNQIGTNAGNIINNSQTTINVVLNLNAFVGQSNLRIRYNYVSTWGYYWIIDNVQVNGTPQTNSFAWTSSPAGFTSTQQNPTNVAPSDTTTYTVTVTTGAGCTASATTTVDVNLRPTSVISGNATVCSGASTLVSSDVTGTGPWSGTLSDATPFSGATSPITVSVSPASTTTYTVATLTDANCTANAGDKTGSAVVTVTPTVGTPTAITGPNIVCQTVGTTAFSTTATNATDFTWTITAGTSTITTGTASATVTWDATFTGTAVITVAANGCGTSATVTKNVTVTGAGLWTGTINNDWFNSNNWCGGIPTATTDVVIPGTTPFNPNINGAGAVARDITVNAGATLSQSANGYLTVHGDLAVNGTYTDVINSTVELGGNVPQTVSGLTVKRLVINNASGITLGSNLTVTNFLTLTDGIVTTGSFLVDVTATAATAVGTGSLTSYINGTLRRGVNASGSYNFPVGTATEYELANITLNAQSGISFITAFFTPGLPASLPTGATTNINGTPIDAMLDGGYWTITPDAQPTAGSYDVTLYERGYTNLGGATAQQLGVIKRSNASSPWKGTGPSGGSTGQEGFHSNATQNISGGTVVAKRTGVQTFSDFGIGMGNAVLPVELVSFTGHNEGATNELEWVTASEQNSKAFVLERSTDATTFEALYTTSAAGNSTVTLTYRYTDHQPFAGVNYYRLKAVDLDETFSYSNVIAITRPWIGNDGFVFPNPASDILHLQTNAAAAHVTRVEIVDLLGRVLMTDEVPMAKGLNTALFSTQRLAQGVYILRVTGETNAPAREYKFVKN